MSILKKAIIFVALTLSTIIAIFGLFPQTTNQSMALTCFTCVESSPTTGDPTCDTGHECKSTINGINNCATNHGVDSCSCRIIHPVECLGFSQQKPKR